MAGKVIIFLLILFAIYRIYKLLPPRPNGEKQNLNKKEDIIDLKKGKDGKYREK